MNCPGMDHLFRKSILTYSRCRSCRVQYSKSQWPCTFEAPLKNSQAHYCSISRFNLRIDKLLKNQR